MKDMLNQKIRDLCTEAGSASAAAMAPRLINDLDKEYDKRVDAGMSELDAYRDVLRNVDQIEKMLKSLPESSDAELAMKNHKEAAKTLEFYLGQTSAVMWVTSVIAFFLVGLAGHAWKYAWLIFLWTTIGEIVLDMTRDYNKKQNLKKAVRDGMSGVLWVGTVIVFFLTGFGLHLWRINWLLFLAAVVAQILLDTFMKEEK